MNITPMIDVLLVLLVIFMAALPLSSGAWTSTCRPKPSTPNSSSPTSARSCSTTRPTSKISINNQDVTHPASSKSACATIFEERKDKTMFIMGAGTLRYGDIVEVIDAAKGAGVEKVGIVTEGMRRAAGAQQQSGTQ